MHGAGGAARMRAGRGLRAGPAPRLRCAHAGAPTPVRRARLACRRRANFRSGGLTTRANSAPGVALRVPLLAADGFHVVGVRAAAMPRVSLLVR